MMNQERIDWRSVDPSKLCLDECRRLHELLLADRDRVAETLSRMIDDRTSGEGIDMDRYRRTETAHRGMKRLLGSIGVQIGKLAQADKRRRHEEAQAERPTLNECFRQIVKESVDWAVYEDWERAAQQLYQDRKGST